MSTPLSWLRHVSCQPSDLDLFFGPEDESPHRKQVREALAIDICRSCPSRLPCLDWALRQQSQHGVMGGVGEARRKALRHAWLKRQQRQTEEAS